MGPSLDKAMQALLELGDPAERRTRAKLVDCALHTVTTLMDADAVSIVTPWSRRGERLLLHAGSTTPAILPTPEGGSAVLRTLAEACEPQVLADLSEDERVAVADACPGVEAGPAIFVPLRLRFHAPAYVAAYRRRGRARFTLNDTRVMMLLATWLGTALDSLRQSTGSQKVAVTDDTTDVYNERFLRIAVQREARRARRFRHDLSLLVIEVDHYEALEAAHGASRAGLLLGELGLVLTRQVRSFDLLGRHGAHGFMMVLPQTDAAGALETAERLREAIARRPFPLVGEGGVTVSMGVATFPEDAEEPRDLPAAAERALDEARRRGGNCVVDLRRKAA